jgi:predicted nucleotidyltransferase
VDTERILAILREHEPELEAAGVLHLRLFGSVARGDNTAASDVDLLADFHPGRHLSLLTLAHHRNRLADLPGVEVHLSNREAMYTHIRDRVLPEAVLAF